MARGRGLILSDSIDELRLTAVNTQTNAEITDGQDTPPRWKPRLAVRLLTYVDDTNGIEKVQLSKAKIHISEHRPTLSIHAKRSGAFLERIKTRSETIGMRMNE